MVSGTMSMLVHSDKLEFCIVICLATDTQWQPEHGEPLSLRLLSLMLRLELRVLPELAFYLWFAAKQEWHVFFCFLTNFFLQWAVKIKGVYMGVYMGTLGFSAGYQNSQLSTSQSVKFPKNSVMFTSIWLSEFPSCTTKFCIEYPENRANHPKLNWKPHLRTSVSQILCPISQLGCSRQWSWDTWLEDSDPIMLAELHSFVEGLCKHASLYQHTLTCVNQLQYIYSSIMQIERDAIGPVNEHVYLWYKDPGSPSSSHLSLDSINMDRCIKTDWHVLNYMC